MKIISDEIGVLRDDIKSARQKGDADEANIIWHRIAVLNALRGNHPALDYADELLEIVRELHKVYCPSHCTFWPIPTIHTADCKKTQALIEKIEGEK